MAGLVAVLALMLAATRSTRDARPPRCAPCRSRACARRARCRRAGCEHRGLDRRRQAARPADHGRSEWHQRRQRVAEPGPQRPDRRRDPVRGQHRLAHPAQGADRSAPARGSPGRQSAAADRRGPGGRSGEASARRSAGSLAAADRRDRQHIGRHRRGTGDRSLPEGPGHQHGPGPGLGRAHLRRSVHLAAGPGVLVQPPRGGSIRAGVRARTPVPARRRDGQAFPRRRLGRRSTPTSSSTSCTRPRHSGRAR